MPPWSTALSSCPSYGSGLRRLRRPILAVCVVVALVVTAISALAIPPARASSASILGVYAGPGEVDIANQLGPSLNIHPAYAMDFLDASSWQSISVPNWPLSIWAGSGYKMIWGVPMIPTTGATMAAGATGAYDQYFKTLAATMVQYGQGSSIIRLGWEFNGDWFNWGTSDTTAAAFVSYWQQIVTSMRSAPGANFSFEWNPDRGGTVNVDAYYPGDAYVDIIGLDVYDTEWATYPGASAEFAHMESQPWGLDWLASFASAHDKPISFPEWGLGWGPSAAGSGPISVAGTQVSGGDDPTFIDDMASWVDTHDVVEANFWDYQTQIGDGHNPQTAAALAADFPPGGVSPSVTSLTGGYDEVASDGGIVAFGAPFEGSTGGQHLNAPIVGMAIDPSTGGYDEVASDGGIFAFGAPFHGSMGGQHLNAPIVGMAFDPSTGGYYEVASDGGIFAFGAPFHGSMGGQHLNAPIVGMAVDPSTGGYYEVASDGGIFAFGTPFRGSMGGVHLNARIVGMAVEATGGGYDEVASDGGIFTFGDSPFRGSTGGQHLNAPIVGMSG